MPESEPSSKRVPRGSFDLAPDGAGTAPGTLVIGSDARPKLVMLDYDATGLIAERELAELDECLEHVRSPTVTWIDVRGIGHEPTFRRLGELFSIHPLALADMVNVPQRPKTEIFGEQQLIVMRMATVHEGSITTEQFSILIGKGFVITVQEEPRFDCLESVRARIRQARGAFCGKAADHLASALVDAVIDGFYPVLEHVGEVLDELEARVLGPQHVAPQMIFGMKRELLTLRRAVWPQRDLLSQLIRDDSPLLDAETRPYFRDSYDHCVQVIDMVETFREISTSLMDQLMTKSANRLNEVMKVLTVLSTIFLPMTFIAGVYGMNFDPGSSDLNMPELRWTYGYPFSLALMAASSVGLLLYYRGKGWIGRQGDTYSRVLRVLDLTARRGPRA